MDHRSFLLRLKLVNIPDDKKQILIENTTSKYELNPYNTKEEDIFIVFYHYTNVLENLFDYFKKSYDYCIFKDIDNAMDCMYLIGDRYNCSTSMYLHEFTHINISEIMKCRYESYKYPNMELKYSNEYFKSYLDSNIEITNDLERLFFWNFKYIIDYYKISEINMSKIVCIDKVSIISKNKIIKKSDCWIKVTNKKLVKKKKQRESKLIAVLQEEVIKMICKKDKIKYKQAKEKLLQYGKVANCRQYSKGKINDLEYLKNIKGYIIKSLMVG